MDYQDTHSSKNIYPYEIRENLLKKRGERIELP